MLNKIGVLGIFIICARAVIHFSPSQSYTKYLKLIFSMMILVQLLQPLLTLAGGNSHFMRHLAEELSMYVGEAVKEEPGADMGYEEQIARIVDYGLQEYAQEYEMQYAKEAAESVEEQTALPAPGMEPAGQQEQPVEEDGITQVQVKVEEIPVITIGTGERNDS